HAAQAVAAHLGDAAVRVEHTHEGPVAAQARHQHAIAADSPVAIAQAHRERRIDRRYGLGIVDDEEVVAEALVLFERKLHDRTLARAAFGVKSTPRPMQRRGRWTR